MRFIYLLLFTSLLVACESSVEMSDLMYQNGTYLLKSSEKPYSGIVTGLESGEIINGVKQGVWVGYTAEGTKVEEGTYTDGYKTGPWKIFHENGEIWKQGSYDGKGLRTGEWSTFDKAGKMLIKGNFQQDIQEGIWEYYHLSGSVRAKGNMSGGKRNGEWVKLDEEGNQLESKLWNMGIDTTAETK